MADMAHLEYFETATDHDLTVSALEFARGMVWVPAVKNSRQFANRLKKLNNRMQDVFAHIDTLAHAKNAVGSEEKWLRENVELLRSQLEWLAENKDELAHTTHVRCRNREIAPRPLVIAEDMLRCTNYRFSEVELSDYLRSFQTIAVLDLSELWKIVPALRLVLMERIAEAVLGSLSARATSNGDAPVSAGIDSLRQIQETAWKDVLEPLIVFEHILRSDPAGSYSQMDGDTREMYRQAVVRFAERSDFSEVEIAEMAIALAQEAAGKRERNSRLAMRRSHVGYYLLAEGREQLYRRANVRPSLRERAQELLKRYPDEFYLLGIEVLTLSMVLGVLWWVNFESLWTALIAALALLIPCSQSAVEIMNFLTTSLLEPQRLPKLDFSEGVPNDCTTMVVVPTLLLNEKQVRQLINSLEVRYVANMSPNVHFALLTDMADSSEQPREDDPLVELCGNLIRELNGKYAGTGAGTFAMFHRHRVYNHREGVWMGWERKRGKLLDFNKLVLGEYDSFPYKAGDVSVLPRVRYVLTLDSDTELPRGAAQRLIGTLAHPLCQAIVDGERNVVTKGYGILQPRVGVSVQSAAQSRLAAIYSGRTGLDIYTRAVSDVYQDLYGEGSFVGKGLYELRTVHRVLDRRFPRNKILSHDLIEGAYTRAGLVSDVEVIDHYPSHYSAYTRRKHRWVRGDWQTIEWLFSRVRNENGQRVTNPISLISRWKILDNLRRSLVEPATLVLFLLAWAILPGRALYWTMVPLVILFVPTAVVVAFAIFRAAVGWSFAAVRDAGESVATRFASVFLSLIFLLSDALVSMDAIWRSLYRGTISRQRLLEWETAAQAEAGRKRRTSLDLYLLFTPVIALCLGAALYGSRRSVVWVAFPVLGLWAMSKLVAAWLDRPANHGSEPLLRKDEMFLRTSALRTWRYFQENSTEEHNWLIPDNVQEDPAQVAARMSPTNLGFLLNARQSACELGYLTVPEFVEQTLRTIETMNRLKLYRGHLLNWYDTRTLAPMEPMFVSSVDSGNLAASLITLASGCEHCLERPLLSDALLKGFDSYLQVLTDNRAIPTRIAKRFHRKQSKMRLYERVLDVAAGGVEIGIGESGLKASNAESAWGCEQLRLRKEWMNRLVADYMPWLLPQFAPVLRNLGIEHDTSAQVPVGQLAAFAGQLQARVLTESAEAIGLEESQTRTELLARLNEARTKAERLSAELQAITAEARRWFVRMDFSFLLEKRRKLLSIGYSVDTAKRHSACYDLLASESRMAHFVAIAKGDIPQEVWFALGRGHVKTDGGPTMISWTGTMFEYLMPAIWMNSYPDTLLERSVAAAVKTQKAYGAKRGVPWGISESAYCETKERGKISYGYRAFGIPELALQTTEEPRLVVAPYASAMALAVDPAGTVHNLRRIAKYRWAGKYGFFESVDFGTGQVQVVRSWMAHHQGMILLSITNFLSEDVVREWFHRDVYVQATDLLLQERAVIHQVKQVWRINAPVARIRIPAAPGSQFAFES